MHYLYEVLRANFLNVFLTWLLVSLVCNLVFDEGKGILRLLFGSVVSGVVLVMIYVIISHFYPSVIVIDPETYLVSWGGL